MSNNEKPGVKIRRRKDADTSVSESETPENGQQKEAKAPHASANSDTPSSDTREQASSQDQSAPGTPASDVQNKSPRAITQNQRNAKATPRGKHVHRAENAPKAPPVRQPEQQPDGQEVQDEGPMPSTDDFAAMFGETEVKETRSFNPGDEVDVQIIEITNDSIFVDLGPKQEGVIDRRDLQDDDGELTVAIGETISAYVISRRGGQITLSTALRGGDDALDALNRASANGIPVEGRVVGTNKGGYQIELMGKDAFCPHSQIALEFTEDPSVHVNQTYRFKVERVDERGRNIVVSRAALLREVRERRAEETLQKLKLDAEMTGVVTRVADFGAFVDLGGIDGLVHVSELGWAHVDHPGEVVQVGQPVNVKVTKIDRSGDDLRIGLSMKELEEDPFLATMRSIAVGDSVSGKITRLAPFGAFIEIAPGVEGLCHISEIVVGRRINHPQDVVSAGDFVEVQVIDVDPRKRTISLSMKRLMDEPWADAAEAYPPGTKVQGQVSSIQSFGIFVTLPSGIDALLPLSHLAEGEDAGYRRHFSPGTSVEATVLDIDTNRQRLTLTRKEGADAELEQSVADYKATKSSEGFGTFADLLKGRNDG